MDLFAGLKTIKKSPQHETSPNPAAESKPAQVQSDKKDAGGGGIATVGDGGAGWKLRALKRAHEKANQSGQSLDQVLHEQHGTSAKELAIGAQEALKYRRPQISGKGGKGAKRAAGPRAGDWTCPGCRASVFASKATCFKCGGAKPEEPSRGKFGSWYDDLDEGSETGGRDGSHSRGGGKGGGGLRVGRESKDADVLKQFQRKLQGSVALAGLDGDQSESPSPSLETRGDRKERGSGGGGVGERGKESHQERDAKRSKTLDDGGGAEADRAALVGRSGGGGATGGRGGDRSRGAGDKGAGAGAEEVSGGRAKSFSSKSSSSSSSSSSYTDAGAACKVNSAADRALLASILNKPAARPPAAAVYPATAAADACSLEAKAGTAATAATSSSPRAADPQGRPGGIGPNQAAAAALRLRLANGGGGSGGNFDAAAALRAKLQGGSSGAAPPSSFTAAAPFSSGVEVVAPLDAQGRRLQTLRQTDDPAAAVKEDFRSGKWRGKATGKASARSAAATNGEADMDVKAMVAFEREGGEDMDETFARNIVRLGARYAGAESGAGVKRDGAGADEEEDCTNQSKLYQSTSHRVTAVKLQEVEKARAVGAHKAHLAVLHTHPLSVENPSFRSDLVVARSPHAMVLLATPLAHALSPCQQCLVVPIQQVSSTRACSEEVAEEVGNFKTSLRRFWGAEGLGCLFFETASTSKRNAWGYWTCVPVPLEVEEDAPLYFKQALADCDEEWATHKASINLGVGGLRKAIPNGFPYFAVEWAQGAGAAHVIEDSDKFDELFGEGVVAGMLGVPQPRHKANGFQGGGAGGQGGKGTGAEQAAAETLRVMFRSFDWSLGR